MIDQPSPEARRQFEAWTRRVFGYGLALLVFAIDRGVKALLLGPVALDHVEAVPLLPICATPRISASRSACSPPPRPTCA